MMTPLFRDATIDDLPIIVEIYNESVLEGTVTADLEQVTIEGLQQWFDVHGPQTRPLWVAQTEAGVVGWLSLSDFYGPACMKTAEVTIYLRNNVRGQGIGTQFLKLAIEAAPKVGVSRLLAFVFRHNAKSLALFTKHDFDIWGLLPGVATLIEEDRDIVILGMKLAPLENNTITRKEKIPDEKLIHQETAIPAMQHDPHPEIKS